MHWFYTSFFFHVREPAVSISLEDVKATCARLLVQAEEAEKGGYSVCLAERMIMEEYGRCLSQILHLQLKDWKLNYVQRIIKSMSSNTDVLSV